jgi:fatty aldehyde-generating acyl-ACP reductase
MAEKDKFAFVIHPIDPKRDAARKYPRLARILPTALIHFLSRLWPPVYISHITGVRSEATGNEIGGWLVACPFTARQALQLPPQTVYRKMVQTGHLAQRLGARFLGLGAFTSIVGDGGVTVAQRLGMPVTTGRSLTVAFAVEALEEAARCRGVQPALATVAVVGATGCIGLACAELLAPMVGELVLVSRQGSRLAQVQARVEAAGTRRARVSTRIEDIRVADVVLSATSATRPVVEPQHLKRDAVVVDVALPPDVSPRVGQERDDVLVVEGGIVDVPGEVDFNFDFGLLPGKAYACMAETMVLALEGRCESYSLGKQVQVEQVHEIARLARKHGFRLSAIC